MPAIRSHSTATAEGTWDAGANRARLKDDGTEAYYRSAFAWQDPDGDPKTKSAYSFIHHNVSSDGTVGAANLTACSAGIAILNGGRTDAWRRHKDRQGVYNHLARHLKDGDREPPELKDEAVSEEKQYLAYQLELKEFDESGQFEGHAAAFGNVDLQGDRIKRGAFAATIAANEGGKWPVFMAHNTGRMVGFSTHAEEDNKGLFVRGEFTLDSDEGRNAHASARHAERLKRPLGLSIGYLIPKDGAKYDGDTGVRTLSAVDVLEFSVAPVPANPRARITRVKADDRLTATQIEGLLREAGFSRHEAKRLMFCMSALREAEPDTPAPIASDDPRATALVSEARSLHFLAQLKGFIPCQKDYC